MESESLLLAGVAPIGWQNGRMKMGRLTDFFGGSLL